MSFQSKSGCPMCSIVSRATAASTSALTESPHSPNSQLAPMPNSPSISSFSAGGVPPRPTSRAGAGKAKGDDEPEIIWHDENFTVYSERAHPVSSIAHLVIIFNLHVPSLYMLSTSDIPLLVQLRDLANRLLGDLTSQYRSASPLPNTSSLPASQSSHPPADSSAAAADAAEANEQTAPEGQFHIGFITPPWKDLQIPVKDHLHAHAYVAPMDRCSWWRSIAYSSLAWYAIDDLIAEIREESSNNRIRSAIPSTAGAASSANVRPRTRPIDRVPNAGARSGTADGHETTPGGLGGLMAQATDLESGHAYGRNSTGNASVSSAGTGTGGTYNQRFSSPPQTPHSSIPLTQYAGDYSSVASGSGSRSSSAKNTPTTSMFVQARANSSSSSLSSSQSLRGGAEGRSSTASRGSGNASTGQLLSPPYTGSFSS